MKSSVFGNGLLPVAMSALTRVRVRPLDLLPLPSEPGRAIPRQLVGPRSCLCCLLAMTRSCRARLLPPSRPARDGDLESPTPDRLCGIKHHYATRQAYIIEDPETEKQDAHLKKISVYVVRLSSHCLPSMALFLWRGSLPSWLGRLDNEDTCHSFQFIDSQHSDFGTVHWACIAMAGLSFCIRTRMSHERGGINETWARASHFHGNGSNDTSRS